MTFKERQEIVYSNDECFEMISRGVVSGRVFAQALAQNYELTLSDIKQLQQRLPDNHSTIEHFEKTILSVGIFPSLNSLAQLF